MSDRRTHEPWWGTGPMPASERAWRLFVRVLLPINATVLVALVVAAIVQPSGPPTWLAVVTTGMIAADLALAARATIRWWRT